MSGDIWVFMDRIGIVVGLIVSVPVFWSFFILLSIKRKREVILGRIRQTVGNRPAVLIVDVIKPDGESIRAQVEHWIRDREEFTDIDPSKIHVAEFRGEMLSDDMDSFIADIRKKIGSIMALGTDRVHLFIRSPMPVALCVGEILSNSGCPIVLYHNQPNVGYQNWGLLYR